ncbi:hypothetical protein [Xanthomonas oryzae]|nr:hypothetical protein [Xanthomonas oryzae]UWI57748.1 hypothetical protein NO430_05590 [Xanthomonas oryzae pv. oryzae]
MAWAVAATLLATAQVFPMSYQSFVGNQVVAAMKFGGSMDASA